jgi:basic membrane protein A
LACAVVLSSGALGQAADVIAPQFPNVKFILFNATTSSYHPNVTSIENQVGEAEMVTGSVMANESKSGKLGFVTGLQLTGELKAIAGVQAGAKLVNPSATVTATFTGDYNDIGKAKSATQAQMANGVDSIIGDLGLGYTGFFEAVKGTKVPVFEYALYPDLGCGQSPNLIGGIIFDIKAETKIALLALKAGTLKPGALFIGLKNPAIQSFKFCPGRGTASDRVVAAATTAKLTSGKVTPTAAVLNINPKYKITNE